MTTPTDNAIADLEEEIASLTVALVQADDGAQQTRLRLLIAARRSQLRDLRRQVRRAG